MQTKIILASLVAAVSADNLLTMRQIADPLGAISKECQADLEEVQRASDLPAVPTAFFADAFKAAQTLTNACDYTPTGSIAAEYTSFVSAAESWASAHTDIANKVEKDCNTALQNIANLCPNSNKGTETDKSADEASGGSPSTEPTGAPTVGKNAAAVNGPASAGALLLTALLAVVLL
ncbi:hypothetical protein V2A60_009182 [Cordyceps javanica]|uniref:Cell wall protein n=1 Tax=Cordyceps javanica TaxID=43265 RepID=A0A545VNL9_9HYPO|nr:hypothetical protein IF1G_08642 [Cordyceps javanica]TQW03322.1 hypothetical protein IF2G_09051 [Cordyceps javanica]